MSTLPSTVSKLNNMFFFSSHTVLFKPQSPQTCVGSVRSSIKLKKRIIRKDFFCISVLESWQSSVFMTPITVLAGWK